MLDGRLGDRPSTPPTSPASTSTRRLARTSARARARASTRCTGSSTRRSSGSPTATSGSRPFHARERELGAVFYEVGRLGAPALVRVERSRCSRSSATRVTRRESEWEARWWSPIINAEHLAMRERAAMVDLSAFAIFDIDGPGALDVVQRLAVRQMDVAVGRAVYTPLLTPQRRLPLRPHDHAPRRASTSASSPAARTGWLGPQVVRRPPARPTARRSCTTRPRAWCTLGLWGPRARDILAAHDRATTSPTRASRSRAPARSRSARCACSPRGSPTSATSAGSSTCRSSRARGCGTSIAEAGAPHGLVPAGIGVYGTTGRLEKCYRAYGFELDGEYNVVEAGMAGPKRQGRGVRRPRGAPAPPRRGARGDPLHADGRRPHLGRAASSATCSAASRSSRRDGEPLVDAQGPALVRHERRRRARRSASTS